MAKTTKQSQIPLGTLFEYRVARLRFWQGCFVRRSIDVWPAGLEGNKLAELDCLAVSFDPQLHRATEVVECKTGARGQGEIDRLLWLKGIGEFTKARSVSFAKLNIAPRTRDFARQVGVDVLDDASIATAERDFNVLPDVWPGFHNPEFGETIVKNARIALTSAQELRKAGKYLFGSFWFTDDFTRIKQLRTLFQLLTEHRKVLIEPAFLLGLGEATTLFTLTILSIASWKNQLAEPEFRQLIAHELSTGFGDHHNLRTLLRNIDVLQREQIEALHIAYQDQGAGRVLFPVKSLEMEVLKSPEWVDAFIDLVSRFSKRPHLATNILQWTDLWAAEVLGAKHSPDMRDYLFSGQQRALESAHELVQAFLIRMWGVPLKNLSAVEIAQNK